MSPSSYLLFVFIAFVAVTHVLGDCYMQNPRGNNDRYDEIGDRTNDKRLFDSENNARGGYCWGPELTFYEGSKLSVEWTVQHSCGNDNTRCNIVLQYMCTTDAPEDPAYDPTLIIRDGTTTTTITTGTDPTVTTVGDNNAYYNVKDNDVFRFGMNEPYSNYKDCYDRVRNKGLFTANQNLNNGAGAMATRQNPNGNRYGFECGEERAYFPYWHPTVWKDIAVLVDNKDDCSFYQKESQNVKAKNFCNITATGNAGGTKPNNADDCIRNGGQWLEQPSFGIGKPDCKEASFSRDNHLGNGVDATTNRYNWTLPRTGDESCIENGNCTCVLRIRYNITVGEVRDEDDSLKNNANSPVQNDPTVLVDGFNYTLALDTAQTGRTFQDRSYMFRIAPRPDGVPRTATIYNLNVRGRRGNIVQTFPATEYDFVPTFLEVDQDDFIHFQWTGCDRNGNVQGEGRTGTDRSNIVQIADMSRNYPLNDTEIADQKPLLFKDAKVRTRFANLDQVNCKSYDDLKKDAAASPSVAVADNPQNCMVLNAADRRFSGGLVKMTSTGNYYYMSTRNNNFSNRSQKGSIKVSARWPAWKTALIVVGGVAAVGIGAAAGAVFYAKRHPLSKVAEIVHKVPGFSKI